MDRARCWCGTMLAVGLLAVTRLSAAATAEPVVYTPGPNVAVTLTVGKVGGNSPFERKYRLLAQDGSNARLLMGWRTPIPTMSGAQDEAGKVAVMSYTYQNIGVSTGLRVEILGSARVALNGDIEISGARDGPVVDTTGTKAPVIGTFQQHLEVVATEGKKLRVAEAPDPEGGTLYLEIDVDVLD